MSDFKKLIEAAVAVQLDEVATKRKKKIIELKLWDRVKKFEEQTSKELNRKYKGMYISGFFQTTSNKKEELEGEVIKIHFSAADEDGMPYVLFELKTPDRGTWELSLVGDEFAETFR